MELIGERRIPAPIRTTWDALNDPDVLRRCIPGCESLEWVEADTLVAVLVARIGPVSARFKGTLRLSDVQPPHGYVLSFEGQGGLAGFGKGAAEVSLTDQDDHTLLRYTANAKVGGRLAQVGSRLIDAAASKLTEDFFAAFEAQLRGGDDPAATQGAVEGAGGGGVEPAASSQFKASSSQQRLQATAASNNLPGGGLHGGGHQAAASASGAVRSSELRAGPSGVALKLAGERLFAAPLFATFNGLTRSELLQPCIVGCESLIQVRADALKVVLAFGVGALKLRVPATLQVSDVEMPHSYVLSFRGRGGSQGAARITLMEEGRRTRVRYALQARVRGPLSMAGSRVLGWVSALVLRTFLSRFEVQLLRSTAINPDARGKAGGR